MFYDSESMGSRTDGSSGQMDRDDSGQSRLFSDAGFFVPNLDQAAPPIFASPAIAYDLVEELKRHRLLVLGGSALAEKTLLAQHVAWYMADESRETGKKVTVLQWFTVAAPQALQSFEQHEAGTIFIFPAMHPHHLGNDLRFLQERLHNHGHYAVLTTDHSKDQWSERGDFIADGIWHDLETRDLYDSDRLVSVLCEQLDAVQESLPQAFLPGGLDGDPVLIDGLRLTDAAQRLETPGRIHTFVSALVSGGYESADKVIELIEELQNSSRAVERWFCQLDHRRQLLALGLAIFDGLFDEQVFAGLELLVDLSWRSLEQSVDHFDYHELSRVAAFFRGTEMSAAARIIGCTSARDRRAIFEVGWKLHRRRLLSTLPTLVQMVRESVHHRNGKDSESDGLFSQGRSSEGEGAAGGSAGETNEAGSSRWYRQGWKRDLFGSEIRAAQFQRAVAETIGELGLISRDAVEPTLIDLARSEDADVQLLAAQALAHWLVVRPDGHGRDRLMETVEEWHDDSASRARTRRSRGDSVVRSSYGNVSATVALIVSHASWMDPPNEMAEPWLRIVTQMIGDHGRKVRARFRNHTLPHVVARHSGQLEKVLWESGLMHFDLLVPIATGLSHAVELQPAETLALLERWMSRCLQSTAKGDTLRRQAGLCVVARAYGGIKIDSGVAGVGAEMVFGRLKKILNSEYHPEVRRAVLLAVLDQAGHCFDQAAPLIQELLAEFYLDEREMVTKRLRALYLAQREELSGGEDVIRIGGRCYPIWLTRRRPLTKVETLVASWLDEAGKPAIQQLALATLDVFQGTSLERHETERLRRSLQQGPVQATQVYSGAFRPRWRMTSILGELAIFLGYPSIPPMRKILRGLVPEFLHLLSQGSGATSAEPYLRRIRRQYLLYRLRIDRTLQPLADALRRVDAIYEYRFLVAGAIGAFLLVGLPLVLALLGAL